MIKQTSPGFDLLEIALISATRSGVSSRSIPLLYTLSIRVCTRSNHYQRNPDAAGNRLREPRRKPPLHIVLSPRTTCSNLGPIASRWRLSKCTAAITPSQHVGSSIGISTARDDGIEHVDLIENPEVVSSLSVMDRVDRFQFAYFF